MANTASLAINLSANIASATVGMGTVSMAPTLTGADYVQSSQTVGTSAEAIGKGDIGTAGILCFWNQDAANPVNLGYDDAVAVPVATIKAGEVCCFRPTSATLYGKATGGNVICAYVWLED